MQTRTFIKALFYKLFSIFLLTGVLSGSIPATKAAAVESKIDFLLNKGRSPIISDYLASSAVMTADVQIPNCPDANGIIRGTAAINAPSATKTAAPQAVSKGGIAVEAKITAYVDDSAELTHFDLEGTATENGVSRAGFSIEESKIGAAGNAGNRQGRTTITISPELDAKASERIDRETRNSVKAILDAASAKLSAARDEWRGGGCVEVKLTAPKMRLAAGEKAVVTAESRHKLEKTAFAAKLVKKEASASATPDEQPAALQSRFTLTAPPNGEKALIVVESVSKRGIGKGRLDFETNVIAARKPPVGKTVPPKTTPKRAGACGAWSGKITAVKRKKKESSAPASGRLLRHIENEDVTFNVEYQVLGIADTSQRLSNAYLADAKLNYRSTQYSEHFYAADKTMCDKTTITTTQLRTMETAMTASSAKRLTVYITSRGEKGHLTMGAPEVKAERIITRKYETACPSYNQANSGVDRDDRLIDIVPPSFEIAFELDAKSDYQLSGSKTIQESDGTEIIVTWNLTRDCK